MKGTITRNISIKECPWLNEEIKEETEVYNFTGPTYGCISVRGVAVTKDKEGREPFFEIPVDAVSWE